MKRILFYIVIVISAFFMSSCNEQIGRGTKRARIMRVFLSLDSVDLFSLDRMYGETRETYYLEKILEKIDLLLAKDSSNIGLIDTKAVYLQLLYGDSLQQMIDSLNQVSFNHYIKLLHEFPLEPSIFLAISTKYEDKKMTDSVRYYSNKAIALSDSILKKEPYNKNVYEVMINSYLIMGKYKEASEILKRDREKYRNNMEFSELIKSLDKLISQINN